MKKAKTFKELHEWTDRLLTYFLLSLLLFIVIVFSGCSALAPHVRTIYVPEGDAIMLRQDVKDVDIWAKPADSPPVAGNMDLEEGWF